MKARDIVIKEVVRQAEFGMEPSWEDFAIAGQKVGIKEVVDWINKSIPISSHRDFFLEGWQAQLKEWGITP